MGRGKKPRVFGSSWGVDRRQKVFWSWGRGQNTFRALSLTPETYWSSPRAPAPFTGAEESQDGKYLWRRWGAQAVLLSSCVSVWPFVTRVVAFGVRDEVGRGVMNERAPQEAGRESLGHLNDWGGVEAFEVWDGPAGGVNPSKNHFSLSPLQVAPAPGGSFHWGTRIEVSPDCLMMLMCRPEVRF